MDGENTPVQPQQPQTTVVSEPADTKSGKINWAKVGIIALVVAIVALIVVLILIFAKQGVTKEVYNLTYSLESENGSLISSGTAEFEIGSIASTLKLASNKLDTELGNISKGENKTIELEAEDAFGEYDNTKTFTYNRIEKEPRATEVNRTNWIDIASFKEAFGEDPEINKEYTVSGAPWPYKVLEKNDTYVKLSQEPEMDQEIPFGTFIYRVISITETKITLKLFGNDTIVPSENGNYELKFTENEIVTTLTPEIGQEVALEDHPKAIVTGMNATHLFLDANNKYAGQKITAKITVNDIKTIKTKATGNAGTGNIPGAPKLQVFVMSYCPYGLQALKGVLPVWEKFQGKANIELRFVSYTMHGQKEQDENYRMICIREEQNAKLIPYLKCFVEAGDYASCIKQAGIDESKLTSCITNKASGYFDEDIALNTEYGVQGSPTFVLNGVQADIYPRDPQSIATAICNAFTGSKPSVCSESFSTENPSPGFGGGSSNSGSGGSCG